MFPKSSKYLYQFVAIAASLLSGQLVVGSTTPTANGTILSGNITGFAPCDALIQAGLQDRLHLPTDAEYEPRINTWWALNTRLHPWCLVLPRSAAEVSTALKTLLSVGEGAGDWHIAVRSGGHMTSNANNIDSGVTIDLGYLNQSNYDKATNTASVGTGAKWKNVLADLHEQGVVVTGGRDGGVGVGGFLLGGGLTYFMGYEGLGCDTVKNFEVVLANGNIINANQGENSDLWKALKGGGSNFGIVTRFDMEALPDNNIAYGQRLMTANYSSMFVDMVYDFTENYQEYSRDALVPFAIHNTSAYPADIFLAAIHVNTQGNINSTGFSKLNHIPAIVPDVTASISVAEAAESSQLEGGSWDIGASITFKNDKQILSHAIDLHTQLAQTLSQRIGSDSYQSFTFFEPYPVYINKISEQNGGNMLGLDFQDGDNAIVFDSGVAVLTNEADLAIARNELLIIISELTSFAESMGVSNKLIYMNYADVSQDVLGSYGKESVDYIKKVAAKYDPAGVFQTRIPGGFKISRVAE